MTSRNQTSGITDHRGERVVGYRDYQFYAELSYWERRYATDHGGNPALPPRTTLTDNGAEDHGDVSPYEWWCGAAELLPLLDLLLPGRGHVRAILDIGCGTSSLLADLYYEGFTGPFTGIDFSPTAIRICKGEAAKRTSMSSSSLAFGPPKFLVGDACNLQSSVGIASGSQDVVIEKGTLSGIISSPDGERIAAAVLREVHRVLKDDGIFLSIQCEDPNDEDESKNGIVVLEELILPPLLEAGCASLHYYSVDIHTSETFRGCYVYALRKKRRARTRAALRGESTVETVVRLHEH